MTTAPGPTEPSSAALAASPWSPLRNKTFATLWLAWLTANTCLWMCDVAAAWLMTTLTDRPVIVALVQTAATLPMFLLALPSGALADIVDRRRWAMGTMLWMALVATALAVLAASGTLSVPLLLALVFANGVGVAMRWPVFAAIVPGVVARHELPQALALHSMAVNASRVIGPLAAGLLMSTVGASFVFVLSALLALGAALLVRRWHYAPVVNALPGERVLGAMRVGIQYVAQSPRMRISIAHGLVLFFEISSLLALLPLVANGMGEGGASRYTVLFTCAGCGAMSVLFVMPWLRRRLSAHGRSEALTPERSRRAGFLINTHTAATAGMFLFAVCTLGVALAPNVWLAAVAMVGVGLVWMGVGNMVSVSAQLGLPDWVRARAMSIMFMLSMGGGAAGAALFGAVANAIGVRNGLLLLAALSVMVALGMRRWRMDDRPSDELTPERGFSPPATAQAIDPEAGPVFVTIEYLIEPEDAAAFAAVMAESRRARLRGGALSWGLLRDAAQPLRQVEYFVDANWTEHLRRFDRLTAADTRLRERRLALHKGSEAPAVTRYVGQEVTEMQGIPGG